MIEKEISPEFQTPHFVGFFKTYTTLGKSPKTAFQTYNTRNEKTQLTYTGDCRSSEGLE